MAKKKSTTKKVELKDTKTKKDTKITQKVSLPNNWNDMSSHQQRTYLKDNGVSYAQRDAYQAHSDAWLKKKGYIGKNDYIGKKNEMVKSKDIDYLTSNPSYQSGGSVNARSWHKTADTLGRKQDQSNATALGLPSDWEQRSVAQKAAFIYNMPTSQQLQSYGLNPNDPKVQKEYGVVSDAARSYALSQINRAIGGPGDQWNSTYYDSEDAYRAGISANALYDSGYNSYKTGGGWVKKNQVNWDMLRNAGYNINSNTTNNAGNGEGTGISLTPGDNGYPDYGNYGYGYDATGGYDSDVGDYDQDQYTTTQNDDWNRIREKYQYDMNQLYNTRVNYLAGVRDQSISDARSNYGSKANSAYITYRQNTAKRRTMASNLGMTGGGTENMRVGDENNYSNSLANINAGKNTAYTNARNAYADAENNARVSRDTAIAGNQAELSQAEINYSQSQAQFERQQAAQQAQWETENKYNAQNLANQQKLAELQMQNTKREDTAESVANYLGAKGSSQGTAAWLRAHGYNPDGTPATTKDKNAKGGRTGKGK